MTMFQRIVLRTIFATDAAIMFAGQWVYRADIRRDSRLAELVYWTFVRELD